MFLCGREPNQGAGPQCNASVDLIGTCWPRSAVGQLVARPCPEYFYGVRYNTTSKTSSTGGDVVERDGGVQRAMSIRSCRGTSDNTSIRCLRNIIHWNLITAFILRNATWFVVQLTMNPEVHESNVVWCRLVTAAYNYFHVTNFFWMFGEGCYLHTAIVLTYSTDKLRKWMFICIGWCKYWDLPFTYQINFIFLFNIVRILMTKLRASTTSETIQYRKAVKATLVLLPLLGITYMLFFVNPGEDEISRIVFIYFNSFLESFQGFFVSVFYCFLNSELGWLEIPVFT
ncbi:hypothetical protein llap_17985 [Limosa lapponica baueri]|uniref:Corticotropin-releasing factor receptor 1 n=1 Tax=Limosa lapponica baueri TaxID=1758121 RepID=A0A2I0TD36_LIMLA|nr:hypothetical protein llap_17985 [Limosa lapponica baueri]